MKYIDADKLITIIEERKAQQDQWINSYHDPINQGISHELKEILSIITSLQQEQPEVDLEKEIEEWLKYGPHTNYPWCTIPDAIKITAEHFFELGLNARKEDKI